MQQGAIEEGGGVRAWRQRHLAARSTYSDPSQRLSVGARIATGTPTGDWRSIDVAYRLLTNVADGSYQGTVTYSLTQP